MPDDTTTYLAWSDRRYAWPPPHNWYRAHDGRWWAPGTGPDPISKTLTDEDNGVEPPPIVNRPRRQAPEPPELPATFIDHRPRPAANVAPYSDLGDYKPTLAERMATPRSLAILAAITLALVVVLFATRSPSGDGTEALNSNTTEVGDTEAAGTTATPATGTAKDAANTEDDGALTTQSSLAGADPEGGSLNTSSVDRPVSSMPDVDRLVTHYRNLLGARRIASAQLTDIDVMRFADTSCTYAVASPDRSAYAAARTELAAEVDNDRLSPEELIFTIDAAVAVFCPDEAQRINLEP